MKINQIIVETTTSGAVASVAQPLGGVQKRSGNKKAGSMFKGKTTNKPFYEDQVNEEDKIIAPGKGSRLKPGLHGKDKKVTALSQFRVPFRAEGLWVSDGRGRPVLEVTEHGTLATEVALALNSFVSKNESIAGGVIAGGGVGEGSVSKEKQKTPYRNINSPEYKAAAEKQHQQMARDKAAEPGKHLLNKIAKKGVAQEGEKVDRMVKHIAKSERGLGHSKKEAENIAWATANKRGYLDNKNKKK